MLILEIMTVTHNFIIPLHVYDELWHCRCFFLLAMLHTWCLGGHVTLLQAKCVSLEGCDAFTRM